LSSEWNSEIGIGPRFWGDEVGALALKIFLPSPQNVTFGGDGGLTVFVNFNM